MKLALPATEERTRKCEVLLVEPKGLLERVNRLGNGRGERGRRYGLLPSHLRGPTPASRRDALTAKLLTG